MSLTVNGAVRHSDLDGPLLAQPSVNLVLTVNKPNWARGSQTRSLTF